MPGVLLMYTIYDDPEGLPGNRYVLREFAVTAGEVVAGRVLAAEATLEAARAKVPPGKDACLARSDTDDPQVVETWF